MSKTTVKIAAMGDIHMQQTNIGIYKETFTKISQEADVLVLCGDLTDHGHPEEAEMLAQELTFCKIPVVGVLGNHDFESGKQDEVRKILSPKAMFLLDDEPFEVAGIGFAGTKGFGGGFGTHMLGYFGESGMKNFVQEVLNESLKLENALAKLETEKKVVVLHYSPVRETVVGEPEEIFPFLGSSRLAEPIDNFTVTVAFHGHAHRGSYEGKTIKGIPVYNVSINVVKAHSGSTYALIEI